MGKDIKVTATSTGKRVKAKVPTIDNFKGYVLFKREKKTRGIGNYRGAFGFDWMQPNYKIDCISDFAELEKEYAPLYKYKKEDTGDVRDGLNSNNENWKPSNYTNSFGKDVYYVPWFSSFQDKKHELQVEIEIVGKGSGLIKFESTDANIVVQLDGGEFDTSQKAVDTHKKTLSITFAGSISEHATIEARYYDHACRRPDGVVIGLLNVYKNDTEYELKTKYVRMIFTGKVKCDGKEHELDPVNKAYLSYHQKISNLEIELADLKTELQAAIDNPPYPITTFLNFRDDADEIRADITETEAKLVEAKADLTYVQDLDQCQISTMAGFHLFLNDPVNVSYINNGFAQALIRYQEDGVEEMFVQESDFIAFYNLWENIEIKKIGADRYELDYHSNSEDDDAELLNELTAKYYEGKEPYKGSVVFLIPFYLGTLLGQAEGLTCEADDVLMTAFVLTNNVNIYPGMVGDPATLIHEVAHALTLHHSFVFGNDVNDRTTAQKHVFVQENTENIMDYTTVVKSLWKWQWERIHEKEECDLVSKKV